MQYQDLLLERHGGVTTITLNKPEKRNATSWSTWGELESAVGECDADDDTKVIIVTGAGQAFCSGTDFTAPSEEREPSRVERIRSRYLPAISLVRSQKPAIAAVNGPAIGAGLSLALACDIRIAAASARFSALFVKRGFVADTGCSYLLPRIVGLSDAFRLLYTGDIISSDDALRIGLVSEVVDDGRLMERVRELADTIARGPSVAVEMIKRLVYYEIIPELDRHIQIEEYFQDRVKQTEDNEEGRRAFLEKREPRFRGR